MKDLLEVQTPKLGEAKDLSARLQAAFSNLREGADFAIEAGTTMHDQAAARRAANPGRADQL